MRIRGARFIFDRADEDFDERLTEDEYLTQTVPVLPARLLVKYTDEQKANLEKGRERMRAIRAARFKASTRTATGSSPVTRWLRPDGTRIRPHPMGRTYKSH